MKCSSRSTEQKVIELPAANSDFSLPIRKIKDEPIDSDTSPPRRPSNSIRRNIAEDQDSLFGKRKKSAADLQLGVLPPCRRIKDSPLHSDSSPPRMPRNRGRQNSDVDSISDISPPRRRKPANDSDLDLSPPRKNDDYVGFPMRPKEFGNNGHQKRQRGDGVDSSGQRKRNGNYDALSRDNERGRKRDGRDRIESSGRLHKGYEGKC